MLRSIPVPPTQPALARSSGERTSEKIGQIRGQHWPSSAQEGVALPPSLDYFTWITPVNVLAPLPLNVTAPGATKSNAKLLADSGLVNAGVVDDTRLKLPSSQTQRTRPPRRSADAPSYGCIRADGHVTGERLLDQDLQLGAIAAELAGVDQGEDFSSARSQALGRTPQAAGSCVRAARHRELRQLSTRTQPPRVRPTTAGCPVTPVRRQITTAELAGVLMVELKLGASCTTLARDRRRDLSSAAVLGRAQAARSSPARLLPSSTAPPPGGRLAQRVRFLLFFAPDTEHKARPILWSSSALPTDRERLSGALGTNRAAARAAIHLHSCSQSP